MQAIDVLRHHGVELAGAFQLRQLSVAVVGLGAKRDHLGPVEVEKLRRMRLVKAVREHSLGRIGKPLVIQTVHAAEIGNAACRGNARAAKEDHVAMGFEQLRQRGGGLWGPILSASYMSSARVSGTAAIALSLADSAPPLLR